MTAQDRIRIDKWLWHARFLKSRTLAGKFCVAGRVRLNDEVVTKAHVKVAVGDVLSFATGLRAHKIWVVKILDLGTRRGPAVEAQGLYSDLSPPAPAPSNRDFTPAPTAARDAGSGRPTKAERRATDKLRDDN